MRPRTAARSTRSISTTVVTSSASRCYKKVIACTTFFARRIYFLTVLMIFHPLEMDSLDVGSGFLGVCVVAFTINGHQKRRAP